MLRTIAWLIFLSATSSCGGAPETAEDSPSGRLPHVTAPIDTLQYVDSDRDSGVVQGDGSAVLGEPPWKNAAPDGLPAPGELTFRRYTNDRFGYSIAVPDTLLRLVAPVGDGRGMEFVSDDGDVRMIVYGAEGSSFEDLDAQYESTVGEPGVHITYRARDEDFYIAAGRREGVVFYEKAVYRGGAVTTFRIEYPAARKAYYDAVTALMASSLDGAS